MTTSTLSGARSGIPISRQKTRSIMEKILKSEELAKVSLEEIHQFFGMTKTINYDQ